MRKEWEVAGRVTRATVFVAACQYYELWLDGERVGLNRLDSPWTNFYTNRSYVRVLSPFCPQRHSKTYLKPRHPDIPACHPIIAQILDP